MIKEPTTEKWRKKRLKEGFTHELEDAFLGKRFENRIWNSSTDETIVEEKQKITKKVIRALVEQHEHLDIYPSVTRLLLMERVVRYQHRLSGEDKSSYATRNW